MLGSLSRFSKELPRAIDIILPDKVHKQEIHCERVSLNCTVCGRIGHTAKGHEIFIKDEKYRKDTLKKGARKRMNT